MSDINAFRKATREAKLQARVKARLDAWWHTTRCPNCQAKVSALQRFLGEAAVDARTPPTHLN